MKHETNLKKQGMLPLTFENPGDYDRINPDDKVDLLCTELAVGKPITIRFKPKNGTPWETKLAHTFNEGTYSLCTSFFGDCYSANFSRPN